MKQPMSRSKSLMFVVISLFSSIFLLGVGFIWILNFLGLESVSGFMASQIGILILALILFEFKSKDIFDTFNFKIKAKHIKLVMLSVLIVIGVNVGIGTTMSFLEINSDRVQGFTENTTKAMVQSGNVISTFILPIIAAPIFEELAFRAGFKRILVDEGNWKPYHYVIISSLVFGLLHWQPGTFSLVPIIVTGVMGVVHSIMYLRTKNILLPIASHMIYNLIVIGSALAII